MYTHKEIARFFQKIYEYKISLINIVKENNTGKASVLQKADLFRGNSFPGILKILTLISTAPEGCLSKR